LGLLGYKQKIFKILFNQYILTRFLQLVDFNFVAARRTFSVVPFFISPDKHIGTGKDDYRIMT
jgi:hypothetical protein